MVMAQPDFRRLEELFHAAIAMPRGERARFLDRECAGDIQLREAVERLIEQDSALETDGRIESPVADLAARHRAEPPTRLATQSETIPPSFLPEVPGYEILEEIGRGGMGIVYKARQISLDRVVALKMLSIAGPAAAEPLERFRSEAKILAKLHQPNIVTIFDVGETNHQPYFTMEFIDGPSLSQYLAGRPQSVEASTRIVELLARAVHALHGCGVVHRDLKPANVLLDGLPAVNQPSASAVDPLLVAMPKITDFGLAKGGTSPDLTMTGTTMGTPGFMAPEQAKATRNSVSPAVDIYALGAILYDLLTGRPPFDAGSPAETIAQLLQEEPVSPARLRPHLPRDLVTICLKCLEKSPKKRYTTALELADDLQRFQSGNSILARPVGSIERSIRWCRRRPLVAGLAALCALLAVAFVVTTLSLNRKLRIARDEAQALAEGRRRQIVQLNVNVGQNEAESGDDFKALLRYVKALELDAEHPEHVQSHLQRIAKILGRSPQLAMLQSVQRPVLCGNIGPNGARVAVLNSDGMVEVWDPVNRARLGSPSRLAGTPRAAAFSSDNRWLAVVGPDNTVHVTDLSSMVSQAIPGRPGPSAQHVAFHAVRPLLIVRYSDSSSQIWNLASSQPTQMEPKDSTFASVVAEPRNLVLPGDSPAPAGIASIPRPTSRPSDASTGPALASANGKVVIHFAGDGSFRAWNPAESRWLGPVVRPSHRVIRAVIHDDGSLLATGGSDGTVRLWKVGEEGISSDPSRPPIAGTPLGLSRNSRHVIVATDVDQGAIRVWDVPTNRPVTPLLRHGEPLSLVSESEDGQRLTTVTRSGTTRVWELPKAHSAQSVSDLNNRSVLELLTLAQILACGQIGEEQEFLAIEPSKLAGYWQRVESRQRR